jgi:uncharacterized membrane protein
MEKNELMSFLKLQTKTIMAITIAFFVLSSGLALPALAESSTVAPTKTQANFHIVANAVSLTLKPGTKETVMITIASQTKFTGRVFLSAQPNKERVFVNLPASIMLPKGATSVTTKLTIAAGPKATPGLYQVLITATSGSLTHTITLHLRVVKAP